MSKLHLFYSLQYVRGLCGGGKGNQNACQEIQIDCNRIMSLEHYITEKCEGIFISELA